ncbi:hypothetical protein D3C87_970060 [compost metagenome]
MLNVRKYLPSMEDFDSLPDTLKNDITTDGENTYVAGIPEELIQPVENTEQGNEGDGTIVDNLQAKNEETVAVKESEDDGSEDESKGETDESTDSTQVEDEPKEKESEEDEEETFVPVQYAIEEYSKLLTNAGDNLSHQSVEMLNVGLSRLHKKVAVAVVSNESFMSGPLAARKMTSAESFLKQLQLLKESIGSTTNL